MRRWIKEAIARSLLLFPVPATHKASVLMYHSVGENTKFSTVTLRDFETQLCILKGGPYTCVPLSTFIEKLESGENVQNHVVLTFDDGYEDFYTVVFPLLKKYGVHATVFVVSGCVEGTMHTAQGQSFTMMTARQIREVVESGLVDVMPHSVSHPRLSEIPLDDAVAEIETSREDIETLTDRPAPFFAYPFGSYNEALTAHLRSNRNWKAAVSVVPGLVGPEDDRFTLKRNSVDSETGAAQFKLKLGGALRWYLRVTRLLSRAG